MPKLEVVARVGAELRRLRLSSGLTAEAVAAELGWSQSKVSRIESGRLGVTLKDLRAVTALLGASEATQAELMTLVAGDDLGAWMVRAGGPRRRQREVRDIEQRVERYREHHPLLVPGQLQCRTYTVAMAQASGLGDVEDLAEERARRQELFTEPDAPRYEALIDARSLRRHPGGPDVLREQVDFLLARMQVPAISVRVLPESSDARAMALGAFLIYEFVDPATSPLVLVETQFVDVYLAEAADVLAYEALWDGLNAEALSARETRSWLVSLREGRG